MGGGGGARASSAKFSMENANYTPSGFQGLYHSDRNSSIVLPTSFHRSVHHTSFYEVEFLF